MHCQSLPMPALFRSDHFKLKNLIETVDRHQLTRQAATARVDFRHLLHDRPVFPGRNVFYVDPVTGRRYWVDCAEGTAKYGISDETGSDLPVRLTRWTDPDAFITICHLCGPDISNPQGIGDCTIVLCDPVFRIPLPIPA